SVRTWQLVPPGTSGGVSAVGSTASVAGAAFVALACATLGWPRSVAWSAFVGGMAGALADSLIGATMQLRRWCEPCGMETEQRVHRCGTPTRYRRGMTWLDNDAVNAIAT